MSLYTPRNNLQHQFQTSTENTYYKYHITPKNKNPIYFRDTKKQFCPHQKYVDHRPFPYRSIMKSYSNFNCFNSPVKSENSITCYRPINKKQCLPLVTRQDLVKYIKLKGTLLKHLRPCYSCIRINKGNYGRNYSTIPQKRFPFINGNFIGDAPRFIPRYKTPTYSRYSRNITKPIKYKLTKEQENDNNDAFYNTNTDMNNMYRKYKINDKEESKNEGVDKYSELNEIVKDNENTRFKYISRNNSNNNIFYKPIEKKRFHKTQIFNLYKPYLVDEFKEYAEYK